MKTHLRTAFLLFAIISSVFLFIKHLMVGEWLLFMLCFTYSFTFSYDYVQHMREGRKSQDELRS